MLIEGEERNAHDVMEVQEVGEDDVYLGVEEGVKEEDYAAVEEGEKFDSTADGTFPEEDQRKFFNVSFCEYLNVRKAPTVYGEVICKIKSGTKVQVLADYHDSEFYKVITEHGVTGFCMKRYIA